MLSSFQHLKKAFTLAEVLITLAIIGVVAALTTPTVVRNYTEKQTIVQLKKAYSQLNSAFQMAVVEHGSPDTWNWGTAHNGASADYIVQTYFVPYLKILKNCGTGRGCWKSTPYRNLSDSNNWGYTDSNIDASKLKFADGTSFRLVTYGSPACKMQRSSIDKKPLNASCAYIAVDLNGEKGPSVLGRDTFQFFVTKYGIYPVGTPFNLHYQNFSTQCNRSKSATSFENGIGCTAWILKHENMDYLRKNMVCTGSDASGYDCHLE